MKSYDIAGLANTGSLIEGAYAAAAIVLELPWYVVVYHILGIMGCFAVNWWAMTLDTEEPKQSQTMHININGNNNKIQWKEREKP